MIQFEQLDENYSLAKALKILFEGSKRVLFYTFIGY